MHKMVDSMEHPQTIVFKCIKKIPGCAKPLFSSVLVTPRVLCHISANFYAILLKSKYVRDEMVASLLQMNVVRGFSICTQQAHFTIFSIETSAHFPTFA